MLISIKNVSKVYKMDKVEINALRNVNLDIAPGEFISLMGPSGAGKSTLLHIIGCLDNPTTGNIEIHGQKIQKMKDSDLSVFRNRHIGFIFQSFNLMPVLNVYENVEYPLMIRREKVDKEKVLHTIESVGLSEYINHRPDELSGGQRQRVAIARALVTDPDIILADEPTANLDSKTGEKIIALLLELNMRHNVTFLFSTHSDMVAKYAKRVINILDGELI
ncbi:MAG TPA: ABC transporter ATP-binding protein [Bacillota bacterium]|nr:ABC transporter ATP-binding protein [Bacillota bacterium]